uniref:Ribonuclease VapC n=1 Tax=Acetithermum autotrophicum TaxID=1446466 RepID=H5SRC1_ACEAU|nr:PilT domain protein [Candidatus Acetothermum autotrophicum]
MAHLLIDTDVLIDHLRGLEQAERFLRERRESGDLLYSSVITHAELLAGARPSEERLLRALLGSLQVVIIDGAVAEQAGLYCRQYRKSHGLLLPDALIAASAKSIDAVLVTLNAKHFPMKDITVLVPYRR